MQTLQQIEQRIDEILENHDEYRAITDKLSELTTFFYVKNHIFNVKDKFTNNDKVKRLEILHASLLKRLNEIKEKISEDEYLKASNILLNHLDKKYLSNSSIYYHNK
jgi:HD superfamily phosphodiesterase